MRHLSTKSRASTRSAERVAAAPAVSSVNERACVEYAGGGEWVSTTKQPLGESAPAAEIWNQMQVVGVSNTIQGHGLCKL